MYPPVPTARFHSPVSAVIPSIATLPFLIRFIPGLLSGLLPFPD